MIDNPFMQIVLAIAVFSALILLLSLIVLFARKALLPQRAIKILVNKSRTVDAYTETNLLSSLNDAGIAIPSACAGAGTCGLCKVTIEAGGAPALATDKARLSAEECERGVRLACQLRIKGNLEIAVSEDILSARSLRATIASTRNLSPLIKEIVLTPTDGESFEFRPGSYVQITAPAFSCPLANIIIDKDHRASWDKLAVTNLVANSSESVTRAYSIASTPADENRIVLLIRLALPPPALTLPVPPGKVSSWLFSLQQGDSVELSGPFGDFYVQDNEHDIVLIGGGVGMAPLRAIAHHQLSASSKRQVQLFYGARSCEDLIYQQEMDELAHKHNRFNWTAALSDPNENDVWSGPVGFIHEIVQQKLIDNGEPLHNCDFYLCGPPLMLQSVVATLQRAGVLSSRIFADDFGSQT